MPGGCIVRLCSHLRFRAAPYSWRGSRTRDWVWDESSRKVLDTSGAEGQIEDLSFDADEIGWGVGPATHHVQGDPVLPLPDLLGHAPPRRVRRPGSEHDHRPLP